MNGRRELPNMLTLVSNLDIALKEVEPQTALLNQSSPMEQLYFLTFIMEDLEKLENENQSEIQDPERELKIKALHGLKNEILATFRGNHSTLYQPGSRYHQNNNKYIEDKNNIKRLSNSI